MGANAVIERALLDLYQTVINTVEQFGFSVWNSPQLHIIQVRHLRREIKKFNKLLADLVRNHYLFTLTQKDSLLQFNFKFNVQAVIIIQMLEQIVDQGLLSENNRKLTILYSGRLLAVLREAQSRDQLLALAHL